MTYKQMKKLAARVALFVKQGWKVSKDDAAKAQHAAVRLSQRASRPRRCLPNGRSMPNADVERDTPANHIHPRHLR